MKKRAKVVLTAAAVAGILSTGGISAYFSDGDTATNTFTVGKISLDLREPGWDAENAKTIVPMQTITKDPQVKNDGKNAEYVFLEVSVPYENVVTAGADGTKAAAVDTELFSYQINSGWTELAAPKKDTAKHTITHLYAYGSGEACTRLETNAVTKSLFDAVTFANVTEDQGLEGQVRNITVNAYGIQADYIAGGKSVPTDVWSVISKQSPSVSVTVAEDAKTDAKK